MFQHIFPVFYPLSPAFCLFSLVPFLLSFSSWSCPMLLSIYYLMEVLQGKDNLRDVYSDLTLLELLALVQVGEQLTPAHIIWTEVKFDKYSFTQHSLDFSLYYLDIIAWAKTGVNIAV